MTTTRIVDGSGTVLITAKIVEEDGIVATIAGIVEEEDGIAVETAGVGTVMAETVEVGEGKNHARKLFKPRLC